MLISVNAVFAVLCVVLLMCEVNTQAIIMKVDIKKIGINNVQKNIKVNKLIFNAIRHDYYGGSEGDDSEYVEIPIRKSPPLIYDYIKQHLQGQSSSSSSNATQSESEGEPGDLSDDLSGSFRALFRDGYRDSRQRR